MSAPYDTVDVPRLLASLCRAAERDGLCISATRVRDLVNSLREDGRREAQRDADRADARLELATEFRVPLPEGPGGYGEVVVRRRALNSTLFAVTDGSMHGTCAWVGDQWQYLGDCGRDAAYVHDLGSALALAEEVAQLERASIEASIRREAGDRR
ncbi:hypothetical protein [Streptomyces sp. Z26]|uniref:hypothetical protein n=1 Tax=Streptomyces sp. Z26 TaxID=2500177 RepID=UPI000EF16A57|nr:hypothetical protein [Streptomyces sp. Z26]RLL66963.1 hypothetical protein D7M15_08885 [Streptomyces sp. Z26]